MVRVPLYVTKGGGGLSSFLSHSFIGNARSQLVDALLRFNLVAPEELHKVLACSLKTHAHTAEDLQAALALTEAKRKRFWNTPARVQAHPLEHASLEMQFIASQRRGSFNTILHIHTHLILHTHTHTVILILSWWLIINYCASNSLGKTWSTALPLMEIKSFTLSIIFKHDIFLSFNSFDSSVLVIENTLF